VAHSAVNGSQVCPAAHAFALVTPLLFKHETPTGVKHLDWLIGGQYSVAAHAVGLGGAGGAGGCGGCTGATAVAGSDISHALAPLTTAALLRPNCPVPGGPDQTGNK